MASDISSEAILEMVKKEMKAAMEECRVKVDDHMYEETMSFYSQGNPSIYTRTGTLGNSPKTTGVSGDSTVTFDAYLQEPSYIVPNNEFTMLGLPSSHNGYRVFQDAEVGASGILGKGGFWSRSLKHMKSDLMESMAAHFS